MTATPPTRLLPDGRELTLYPQIFTMRLCIGEPGALGYDDFYCYADPVLAAVAFYCWDGEGDPPDGWTRHGRSGRRRPGGDPAREHGEHEPTPGKE